jgi:hypothetical protein
MIVSTRFVGEGEAGRKGEGKEKWDEKEENYEKVGRGRKWSRKKSGRWREV